MIRWPNHRRCAVVLRAGGNDGGKKKEFAESPGKEGTPLERGHSKSGCLREFGKVKRANPQAYKADAADVRNAAWVRGRRGYKDGSICARARAEDATRPTERCGLQRWEELRASSACEAASGDSGVAEQR